MQGEGRVSQQERTDEGRGLAMARRSLTGLLFLILAAAVVVVIAIQQRASGAFSAAFSATNADEASHYVTGLMLADYVRSGFPAPLAFARDYYLHFPKVGIGHWPPLYYALEAGVFLLFSAATPVALLLPAILAALLTVTAGFLAHRRLGILIGIAVGAALLALAPLRETTIVIMLDLPVALLGLLAALAYARFLDTERWTWSVLFALLASAAILTKGTGAALVLLPPLVLLFCGRFDLLRRGVFWLPVPLVLVLAGPWTLATYSMAASGFQYGWGTAFFEMAARAYASALVGAVGSVLLALAACGVVFAASEGWRRRPGAPVFVCLSALGLGFLLFQCVVPAGLDPRYLVPVLAPLVLLAAFGATRLIGLISKSWPLITQVVVASVLLLAALPALLTPLVKPTNGMEAAARTVADLNAANPLVLVGSDALGEGGLVAGVAQRDRAKRLYVLRGSKLLAASDWNGANYSLQYPDAAALLRGLDDLGIGFVALDTASEAQKIPHNQQIQAAIAAFPDRFVPLGTFPRSDGLGEVRLYQLSGNGTKVPDLQPMRDRIMQGKAF